MIDEENLSVALPIAHDAAFAIREQLDATIASAPTIIEDIGFVPSAIGGYFAIDEAHLGAGGSQGILEIRAHEDDPPIEEASMRRINHSVTGIGNSPHKVSLTRAALMLLISMTASSSLSLAALFDSAG
ncbi:MAG: hypothetical protein LM514_01515 [Streptococcus sp.]|nr:hypothetical protein [Streptococcus sp.]